MVISFILTFMNDVFIFYEAEIALCNINKYYTLQPWSYNNE